MKLGCRLAITALTGCAPTPVAPKRSIDPPATADPCLATRTRAAAEFPSGRVEIVEVSPGGSRAQRTVRCVPAEDDAGCLARAQVEVTGVPGITVDRGGEITGPVVGYLAVTEIAGERREFRGSSLDDATEQMLAVVKPEQAKGVSAVPISGGPIIAHDARVATFEVTIRPGQSQRVVRVVLEIDSNDEGAAARMERITNKLDASGLLLVSFHNQPSGEIVLTLSCPRS